MSGPRVFLEYLRLGHFGAFHNYTVGPFESQLNVVLGANESGKTTLASLVGGVLFGWGKGSLARNDYRPEYGDRSGALLFSDGRTLAREGEDAPVTGAVELMEDIDKDTFHTMFSLDSDELRSLRNSTDTTAKLLTASTGTASSPAAALARLNIQLESFTAPEGECSIPHLIERRNALREQQQIASDQADRWRAHDRELHGLTEEREAMAERVEESRRLVESLAAAKAAVCSLDAERTKLTAEIERLNVSRNEATAALEEHERGLDERLVRMTGNEDRSLRDRLDVLAAQQQRLAHATDVARTNYTSSAAVYEALLETVNEEEDRRNQQAEHRIQVAFCVVVPAVLFLLGVPLFIEGRATASLSYMAIGFLLSVFAFIMVVAGFALLFRPDKAGSARKQRFEDAQWVMVQDAKKMEACQAEESQFATRVAHELADEGLSRAEGSLRQARVLLDEARDARSAMALCRQRQQAAIARAAQVSDRLGEIAAERAAALEQAGLPPDASQVDVDGEYDRRLRQRAGLLEAFEEMNRRAGELEAVLSQAARSTEFDRCKIEVQQVCTRLDEAKTDFGRLLLAKRMLEAALATWEATQQPEVYAQASRLLALMTEGRWVEVSLTSEGALQVTDAAGIVRPPAHLSLGTCQQLYLSLRIALLSSAATVGRSIPVLADDILVNFDDRRRLGAARALVELSQHRQVILFTGHENVARALKKAAKQASSPAVLIEL